MSEAERRRTSEYRTRTQRLDLHPELQHLLLPPPAPPSSSSCTSLFVSLPLQPARRPESRSSSLTSQRAAWLTGQNLFFSSHTRRSREVQRPSSCIWIQGFKYLYLTAVFLSLATFYLESRSLCTCCCFHWKNTAFTDHSHSCTCGYSTVPQLWGQRSAK